MKSPDYVKSVLEYVGQDYRAFMNSVRKICKRTTSIKHLRMLWGTNYFAKAYRIISVNYLRKYSYGDIINTKVKNKNVMKHLKYRYKMMEGVEDP